MVEGNFFSLCFGNVKRALLPELSEKLRKICEGLWMRRPSDNDFAVSAVALTGPDIWIDPSIVNCFFLSESLGNALKAAKIARRFELKKCRVIEA